MQEILFWKDKEAKILDPRLFSMHAENMAKAMTKDWENSNKTVNKRTQLRKFYDEVIRLNGYCQGDSVRWDRMVLPQVHMLTAKAAYAHGRKLISKNFMDFIKDSVDQVESSDDLKVFSDFFEAFMGFYRLHGPSN